MPFYKEALQYFLIRLTWNSPLGHAIGLLANSWVTEKPTISQLCSKWRWKQMVGRTVIRLLHVNRRLAAASNYAAFATAAAVVVATHDVVEAASGSGDGTDDYIAMSSPCESPVGRKLHVNKDGQYAASEPSNSKSSASSRSRLVTRLSSALQSWTSGRGSVDDGSRLGPPREGRPGPYGAKYTQEGMMKTKIDEHPATGVMANGGLPEEGNKESIENDRSNPCETDASPHLRGRVNDPYLLVVAATPAVTKNVQEGLEGTSAWSTSDSAVTAGSSVDQGNQGKKKGLWEWKAERSRLDQAIRKAETERDREKDRANGASILLKEAMAMTHPDADK